MEHERKFLVTNLDWRARSDLNVSVVRQNYLTFNDKWSTRVRLRGSAATLTTKSEVDGFSRFEYEQTISFAEGERIIQTCELPQIRKDRYKTSINGKTWEIDVFHDHLEGLVMAEVEFRFSSKAYDIDIPSWCGLEVTEDKRFYNLELAKHGIPEGVDYVKLEV